MFKLYVQSIRSLINWIAAHVACARKDDRESLLEYSMHLIFDHFIILVLSALQVIFSIVIASMQSMRGNPVTYISLLFLLTSLDLPAAQKLDMQVAATKHAKMKLLIAMPAGCSDEIQHVVDVLKHDLSFSDQFDVQTQTTDMPRTKKDVKACAAQGFPVMIYVRVLPREIEWRLFNTITGSMLKGKKYKKRGSLARGWAHAIADMVWPELTAQPGFFSSKIAYCKQIDRDEKQSYKHVYIADYDGAYEQPLVHTPTVNVGPRFNHDPMNCLLFYSQFTNENIELLVADMHKRHRIISTFDGVNMLPSFSNDGKKVAYCASKGTGNCQIYYFENKKLTQITNNEGNNISPALADDGKKIYFCSDMHRCPSIYCFDLATKEIERITKGASSMSPSYCPSKNALAYCRRHDGAYQVFVYDCSTKKHRQLTTSAGHKSECCWSPCGNYVLYGVEKDKKQYLETAHLMSKKTKRIATKGQCSYPAWSPCYRQFPVVA